MGYGFVRSTSFGRGLALAILLTVATVPNTSHAKTAPTAAGLADQPRLIEVDDIHRLKELTEPVFSPDGKRVAYVVSEHDVERDEAVSSLWVSAWDGGKARRLTRSAASFWQPRYSPDGRWIYCLSDASRDETVQLWRIPANGGPAQRVSDVPGGVQDFDLAPDNRRAVVVVEIGEQIGVERVHPAPVVVTRFHAKEDGRNWLDDRRQQLAVLDLKSGKTSAITNDRQEYWYPAWSPDGSRIAVVTKIGADADRSLDFEVGVIGPDGTGWRNLSNNPKADNDPGWLSRPAWSPSGDRLVWLQGDVSKWIYYPPMQLTIADVASGSTSPVARIDRAFTFPRFSGDGKAIYSLIEQDRDTRLARIDLASDRIDYLSTGSGFALEYALGAGDRLAVLESTSARPAELQAVAPDVPARAITSHNDWIAPLHLATTKDVTFRSDNIDIHGMLVLPPDAKPGQPLPMIVRLHGGPVYQFSHEFMIDWQVYAAKGYAVLAINPRGSSGRGFDFARAIYADWGHHDVDDVKAGIDWAIKTGVADPARIGIGGWSYGGILTNYMIASDNRIKAAISGAGMGNFMAGYGSDQYALEYELELGAPWENESLWRKLSYPFLKADRITTPTLFLCAERDFNVPCIGGEQMYQALKSRKVPSELVIYPSENHGLTVPSYLEDRIQRSLAWYDRWLKP